MPAKTSKRLRAVCATCKTAFSYPAWEPKKYCNRQCYKKRDLGVAARFWSCVDKSGECWLWTGLRTTKGYGLFSYRKRHYGAHRFAWVLRYGAVPPGMEVCHDCPGGDNKLCVRHLWLGTRKENAVDAANKGQMPRGERVPRHILTSDKVMKIRAAKGTKPQSQIAKEFGVHIMTVNDVLCGRSWKHVK